MVTNHIPLLSIFGPKYAILPLASARLQRWVVLLSASSYEVEFRRTDRHTNADSLSRLLLKNQGSNNTVDEAAVFSLCQIYCLPVGDLEIRPYQINFMFHGSDRTPFSNLK